MSVVRIGVSGWRYAPWRGAFYPSGLRQADELAHLAGQLPTVEINGTFYSLQSPASFAAWHDSTPASFVFAVKAPRYITHIRRLKDIDKPLANFFASGVFNLGAKLGPILWQFAPQMRFDAARFEHFIALLPRDTSQALALARRRDARMTGRSRLAIDTVRPLRHAVEVRHPSFAVPEFVEMLRAHGVAWVVADTGGRWPEFGDVTADFLYLRLHGATELYRSRYSAASLDRWAQRIAAWREGSVADDMPRVLSAAPAVQPRDVYCYFDNTDKLHAPDNARALQARFAPTALRPPAAERRAPPARARTTTPRAARPAAPAAPPRR
jgi:uncharacterized protein YecE (DUF72 family)